jgi:hypothetical protein
MGHCPVDDTPCPSFMYPIKPNYRVSWIQELLEKQKAFSEYE